MGISFKFIGIYTILSGNVCLKVTYGNFLLVLMTLGQVVDA